jgi:hypothetical protein
MIEEDRDRHEPSSWQYRDVEVDIDDPDIRRLIDEYRKPKTKLDNVKSVRAARRERQKAKQKDLRTLQHLKRTTDYLKPHVRLPKPEACLLCKESFKDIDYFAKGMCKTCYFKYKRLCRQNPDLAA